MNEILDVQSLVKDFDGVRALANFSLSLRHGEILGLIGPNGSGKTTFFNVVSGYITPESGRVFFKTKDVTYDPPHRMTRLGISRTFQNLRLIRQISVIDNVLLCFPGQPGENLLNIFLKWGESRQRERMNRQEAMALLDEAGLSNKADDMAEELSYGQQKLLSLVCCLAAKSDLLLLDEPVAGIAPEMSDRILANIHALTAKGKSVILIEHNLDAVKRVCSRVIFMDAGAKVMEGTPDEVRNDPSVIEAYVD